MVCGAVGWVAFADKTELNIPNYRSDIYNIPRLCSQRVSIAPLLVGSGLMNEMTDGCLR